MDYTRQYQIEFFPMVGTILCVRYCDGRLVEPIIYTKLGITPYMPGLTQENRDQWDAAAKEAGW